MTLTTTQVRFNAAKRRYVLSQQNHHAVLIAKNHMYDQNLSFKLQGTLLLDMKLINHSASLLTRWTIPFNMIVLN